MALTKKSFENIKRRSYFQQSVDKIFAKNKKNDIINNKDLEKINKNLITNNSYNKNKKIILRELDNFLNDDDRKNI